jgi:hypothetical protein
MKNTTKAMLALAIATAALSGGYLYRASEDKVPSAAEIAKKTAEPSRTAATPGPATEPQHRSKNVEPAVALAYAMLNKGASMQTTLEQVAGPGGRINSRELATLVQTTDAACSDVRENSAHYLGQTQQQDPTRSWATTRLMEICHEFDASRYPFDFPKDGLTRVMHEQGDVQAIEASLQAVKKESDPSELYTAGQILLEKDRSKLAAILPNGGRDYGDLEVMKAWALATTMLACNEAGGCGPNSVQTAAFCANTGCQPGSEFSQAIRQRLPESEYRAVNAFYSWMVNQRRS